MDYFHTVEYYKDFGKQVRPIGIGSIGIGIGIGIGIYCPICSGIVCVLLDPESARCCVWEDAEKVEGEAGWARL